MSYTYNNANNHPAGIATASINIATTYNHNPDADYIVASHEDLDAIVDYFKDHAVYKYNADLTMDGQLKFKGKPVIAYIGTPIGATKMSDAVKQMLNSIYGAGMFKNGAKNV